VRRSVAAVGLAAALLGSALGAALFGGAPAALGGVPSPAALAEIPGEYLLLYQRAAATCPGLSWSVLAAIGLVESGHGQNLGPSSAGAVGPMQFLPSTWAAYAVDGDGDGLTDVFDPDDAIPGAARLLCANGAGDPSRLRGALWNYNHSLAYVETVLGHAVRYGLAYGSVSGDVAALLANPNVRFTTAARGDLETGVVDGRVVALLSALATRHTLDVAVFRSGHSPFVAGTTSFSNHWFGRAVDIFRIDGEPVSPSSVAARNLVLEVLSVPESTLLRPSEVGHPWSDLDDVPGSFSDAAHQDHVHIGWE
jgi:hypothetical protein